MMQLLQDNYTLLSLKKYQVCIGKLQIKNNMLQS